MIWRIIIIKIKNISRISNINNIRNINSDNNRIINKDSFIKNFGKKTLMKIIKNLLDNQIFKFIKFYQF